MDATPAKSRMTPPLQAFRRLANASSSTASANGIQLADCRRLEGLLLERGEAEQFVGMDASELRLSVVDGVRSAA